MSIDLHNRREFLKLTSRGVSALALSSFLNKGHAAGDDFAPKLHHAPKAKSVILLYMSGGFSHVDSFDPKPLLRELNGKPIDANRFLEQIRLILQGGEVWDLGAEGVSEHERSTSLQGDGELT